MTEFLFRRCRGARPALIGCVLLHALMLCSPPASAQGRPSATDRAATRAADRSATRTGDYIVAIVNQELVTAVEVERRVQRAREEFGRPGAAGRLPPAEDLQKQMVDALIDERVILTHSRETGARVDDAEVDRAVQAVAVQNQIPVTELRQRLSSEGIDFARFRSNLREQMMMERTREREVYQRIRITDGEIDKLLDEQRAAMVAEAPTNLAQILVAVPDGADLGAVAERRARADAALARVRGGEAFEAVARELSDDASRQRGGELGPRPAARLPDLFVEAIKGLKSGDLAPQIVRSGAGFHILKVLSAPDGGTPRVTQTRARHILLRVTPQVTAEQAQARLAGYRRVIDSGSQTFDEIARKFSEDGSSAQGGDLGWTSPGVMVAEFEEAMNRLAIGGLSPPVVSRFGHHLIQVLERRQVEIEIKQLREQARNTLREQKFDDAYTEWVRDLRSKAYVEMREPPL